MRRDSAEWSSSTTATGAIPGTGVAAAAFNVTATGSNATGVLAVVPGDQLVFETSNLNFATGQTIANQVVSGTGYLGIWVSNASGGAGTTVHVVVDVAGYFRS